MEIINLDKEIDKTIHGIDSYFLELFNDVAGGRCSMGLKVVTFGNELFKYRNNLILLKEQKLQEYNDTLPPKKLLEPVLD